MSLIETRRTEDAMSLLLLIRGTVGNGEGWSNKIHAGILNWKRMLIAHWDECPEIEIFAQGTFNVQLVDPSFWIPPHDTSCRINARSRGIMRGRIPETGADFLYCGNYIHPTARVISINGVAVEGRLYYPGVSEEYWPSDQAPKPPSGTRIEIISPVRIRSLFRNPSPFGRASRRSDS